MTGTDGAPSAGELEVPEPTPVDAGRPNIARVYDYLLGGYFL
jgi:S-adenosyl methyltransferase